MPEKAINRFKIELRKLKRASEKLRVANEDSVDRGLYWSSVLKHAKNATGALIRAAGMRQKTKPLHHRMKHEQKNDAVLTYLLHARNAEEHAGEHDDQIHNPIAEPEMRVFGNAFVVGDNSSISLINCSVDGVPITGKFAVRNGQPRVLSQIAAPVQFRPRQVVLSSVRDQNGNEYSFPLSKVPPGVLPEIYAVDAYVSWLEARVRMH